MLSAWVAIARRARVNLSLASTPGPVSVTSALRLTSRGISAGSTVFTRLYLLALTLVTSITTPVIHARACETSVRYAGAHSTVFTGINFLTDCFRFGRFVPIVLATSRQQPYQSETNKSCRASHSDTSYKLYM